MKNEILLRRKNAVLVPTLRGRCPTGLVAAFNLNLQSLGYTATPELLSKLRLTRQAYAESLMVETLQTLRTLRGVTNYRPMYPNFPEQVAEASDAELYLNAIFHYFSFVLADVTDNADFIWLPKYAKIDREPLDEKVKLTKLGLGVEKDLWDIVLSLVTSNTSISETDKKDLTQLIQLGYYAFPDKIPYKENLCVYAAALVNARIVTGWNLNWFKTGTDVLRLATALSGGDVSLAENTKFRSFKRFERRLLMTLLSHVGDLIESFARDPERWIRLGERLHPAEFKGFEYKAVKGAFSLLRNNVRLKTFNSETEELLIAEDIFPLLNHLRQRPGELARRLDHIFTLSDKIESALVVRAFRQVADQISTPVLLQVLTHFKNRPTQDMRVVFPKGSLAAVQALEGSRPKIATDLCSKIVQSCEAALEDRFSDLSVLGKVYIDPELKNYLLPFSQRSASKSLRTLVRGSKISFSAEKDTIRFFIHWKNIGVGKKGSTSGFGADGRVDLDLSAVMYSHDWKNMGAVWYGNLRDQAYKAYHSGDITSAPNGASEFIDVDIPSVIKYGGRYVAMSVNAFTGQSFVDVPECFAGWMLRQQPQSGEVFEPKTVEDKIDLTTEGKAVMPLIIDLVERRVIWADAAITVGRYGSNIRNSADTVALIGQAFTKIAKPTLYDLLTLHASARGHIVADPKNADVVFSVKTGIQFELDKIASEFMQ